MNCRTIGRYAYRPSEVARRASPARGLGTARVRRRVPWVRGATATVVAASVVTVAVPRPASACSADAAPCVASLAFDSSSAIPPGIGGIPFDTVNATAVELRLLDGTVVGATVQDDPGGLGSLVVPAAPLEPLTDYVMAFHDGCLDGDEARSFSTGEDRALPGAIGSLRATVSTSPGYDVETCQEYEDVVVTLTVQPDTSLAPWLPVTAFDHRIDVPGTPVLPGAYGVPEVRRRLRCDLDRQPVGWTEGPHTFVVEARLPGVAVTLPAVTVTADVTCGARGERLPEQRGGSDAGGCAIPTGKAPSRGSAALLVLVLASVLRGRRRRPAPSS